MSHIPLKIGIILSSFGVRESAALKYIVLHQNTLQRSIEFQFLPIDETSELLKDLETPGLIDRESFEIKIANHKASYKTWLREEADNYEVPNDNYDGIIVISLAKFTDNYYLTWANNWAILALGHWESKMAPPSVLEFILTLLIQVSVDIACGTGRHHETKGCAFDFTALLADARYKVLTGFVCSGCIDTIKNTRSEQFIKDIQILLNKDWLGVPDDPSIVSITAKKLGYDLFHTKGFKPTTWERIKITLEEQAVKTVLKIIGSVIIAALLVWLGLKKGS